MGAQAHLIAISLISGLGVGSIYVLLALSYNLVLSSSGVFNLAQGTVVMGATLASYTLQVEVGLPFGVVAVILVVAGFGAGWLTEIVGVRPVASRSGSIAEAAIVTTLGLSLIGGSIANIVFGSDPKAVPSYTTTKPWFIGDIPILPIYVIMVGVTLVISLAFDLTMRRTQLGHVLRATLEDREAAATLGIDIRRVTHIVFGLAGLLGAFGGLLLSPVTGASPFVADNLGFYGFAALAVGGFGSFAGSLVGGLLVGIVQSVVPALTTADWARPATFIVLMLVLMVKPGGLMGTAGLFGSRKLREV